MDTSRQTTWPPPPDLPDPLAAHDAFLAALVCAPATKSPMSRMRLYRALQKETGMERRQCWLLVRDYCDRHDIFPQVRGLKLWLHFLPSLASLCLLVAVSVIFNHLNRLYDTALTRAARHVVIREILGVAEMGVVALLGLFGVLFLVILSNAGRAKRQAEEARRKVGNGLEV